MTTKERQQTSWSDKCKERYPHICGFDDATMGGFWYPSRVSDGNYQGITATPPRDMQCKR